MKFKSLLVLFFVFVLALSACQPTQEVEETEAAASEEDTAVEESGDSLPAACLEDEFGCAVIPAGDTIKIGMGAPMLGDYSMFGIDISNGVALALNADEGIEGWKFELLAEDTGGTPEGGAAVANKLVTDPTVVAIAGHIFTASTDAAIPIYEKAGFPMLSPSVTNPALTTKGYAVFNRLAFSDALQGKLAAELLFNDLGITKLALVHDGGTYGQGLATFAQERFEELGGEVVGFEAITTGEADYVAPLSAIAAAEPEAVFFGGYAAEATVMVNQWAQAGLDGVLFFGCDGTFGVEFTEKTGANGEGSIAASMVPEESSEKAAFDSAFLDAYGQGPGSLSAFSWAAFDTGGYLMTAVKAVAFVENETLYVPRGALVEAMREVEFAGLLGLIKCDATGECNDAGPTFFKVVDGVWVPLELGN